MENPLARSSHRRKTIVCALLSGASLCASAQDCEVKLGAAGPMTGPGASWGAVDKGWHRIRSGLDEC